jgi:hypothetical protein
MNDEIAISFICQNLARCDVAFFFHNLKPDSVCVNPLNAELNPICLMLALGVHHILHVGRIRVNAFAVDKG